MARATVRRRLASVLFLDIVGSTALATSLGDARWRDVLTEFRRTVRAELRRFGGREQDTTGDGFFVTFDEPARALRCAVEIVVAVQRLGLDVRAGVHTGECEEIDGKLGGIAVHIGARVMSLAGPAEVLTTGTVRELVAGSAATFEPLGPRSLKGVEGEWPIFRLRAVEVELPQPLAVEVAAERIALVARTSSRSRKPLVAAGAAVALAVAAAIAAAVGFGGGRPSKPITMVRVDPQSGRIVAIVRDSHRSALGCGCGANLWAVDGTLWEGSGAHGQLIATRSPVTGRLQRTWPVPTGTIDFAVGLGSVWALQNTVTLSGADAGMAISRVERIDELSGRVIAKIPIRGPLDSGSISVGNGAVWALNGAGTLDRIDPATNRVVGSFATGAIETHILLSIAGYEWICECTEHEVLRYDPTARRATTFHFAEQPWHLVIAAGPAGPTLWLLDGAGATLTPVEPGSGRPGEPYGLAGHPTEAVVYGGSIWVAAGTVVNRVVLATGRRTTIPLPAGVNGTGIAVDTATGAIWVDNSV
ncbi:MAG TPA: adenylate/guanylate cyclase domain-containing protein [Gaiellaceae bacterium]|nr:adenylate/guanylate cyclase domain-containing protein [Gaiellaceae bacterium]